MDIIAHQIVTRDDIIAHWIMRDSDIIVTVNDIMTHKIVLLLHTRKCLVVMLSHTSVSTPHLPYLIIPDNSSNTVVIMSRKTDSNDKQAANFNPAWPLSLFISETISNRYHTNFTVPSWAV